MQNKILQEIWKQQPSTPPAPQPLEIIKKASLQGRNQKISIVVMGLTATILIVYAIWQFPQEINTFIVGLFMMITSMVVRIAVEIASNWRKITGIIYLDSKQYMTYLKRFYTWRKHIHFVITPISFGVYVYGLLQLFPYFKKEFSHGFYIYLIASATISLLIIALIIIHQIKKELRFLKWVMG